MKARLHRTRVCALAAALIATLWLLGPQLISAQFATPTVDGSIGTGEYGVHEDGQNQQTSGGQIWYVTWNDTNLYVAITNASLTEAAILYLDKDPLAPINGGTNANGTIVGQLYDNTNFEALQFRADLVVYFKNGYREYRTADGSNGWSSATTDFGAYADSGTGNVRELAIPWSVVGGRPSSFAWFGYLTSSSGYVYGQVPTENTGGYIGSSARWGRYYIVNSTADGASTKPFSRNCYVFNNTSDISGFGDIAVYDFTMNSTGRTITRGSGDWTIGGSLRVDNGTIDFGSTTSNATVTGDVVIGSSGTLKLSTASGGDLSVAGNWINNGTFTHNNRTVTFNKNGNQTISGSSSTTFGYITLNMGTSNTNVLDVQSVISMLSDGLMLNNGTFKLSSASTITPFAGSTTIPSTAGFYLNHANAVSNWGSSGSLTVNGALTLVAGTMTVGSSSGNELEINGTSAVVTVSGGTLKVAGRVRTVSSGLLTISGGEIVVPTVSHSSANASFYMQPTGRLMMDGGTVTIERANGSTGGDIKIESGSGSKSIAGGTFQVGNASTPSSQTILVNSAIAIHNLTVNSINATARLSTALTVNGNIHIAAGTLDANNLNLTIGGNWTNDGTFNAGTGTVTFNGSSGQTLGGSATTPFNNLTINNSSGVTLDHAQQVNGTLTLTNGRLALGSNDLTLGTLATVSGSFDSSRMVVTDGTGALGKSYAAAGTFTFPIGDATSTPNYSPAILAFNSGSFPLTAYVRVTDALHPQNNSQHRITRYWTVTSASSGFSCDTTFYYVVEDIEGDEDTIHGLSYDGSSWTVYDLVDTESNSFDMTVSSFSDFTGGNNPTGITLASFTATDCPAHVLVEWKTSTEVDLVGFNLHRAPASAGPFTPLNPLLIPAKNPGSPLGAAYAYTDTTVTAGPYWYRLELHTTSGSEWTDPLPIIHAPHRLYLPLILKSAG